MVYESDIKNTYKHVFNNLNRYSGIIVSTKQQQLDISARINNEIPVHTIPVGYIDEHFTNLKRNNHSINNNKIISVKSRLLCKMLYNVFTISTYQN